MATLHPYLGVTKQKGYRTKRKNAYYKISMRRYILNVHKKHDNDIIEWLEANKPYATALKKLIREQIIKEKE